MINNQFTYKLFIQKHNVNSAFCEWDIFVSKLDVPLNILIFLMDISTIFSN